MPLHQWRSVPQYKGSPYEERWCPQCDLHDRKCTSNPGFPESEQWKVHTPCIERVDSRISYGNLVSEIFRNVKGDHAAHKLLERVRCVGVPSRGVGIPGKWQVGFYIAETGVVYPHRDKPFRSLEQGFAELLRWLRARQFDPYKYSNLQQSESRANSFCGCDDD